VNVNSRQNSEHLVVLAASVGFGGPARSEWKARRGWSMTSALPEACIGLWNSLTAAGNYPLRLMIFASLVRPQAYSKKDLRPLYYSLIQH